MTLVTRQAMSDDDGTFTFGTAVNKAFVDQLYDQMDDQVHSATNATIKPKAITDEVVTARNGQASLNAYLATLVSTGYLTGTSDLGQDFIFIGGRAIRLRDSDVAHGMTNEENTTVWGSIAEISSTAGGAIVKGLADVDQRGLEIYGINGSATPALAGLTLSGAKKSGADAAAMASAEVVMNFNNYSTNMALFYGDGSLNLVTGGIAVGFAGQPGADEVQVGDANFKLDYTATNVSVNMDAGDYLAYDRTDNEFEFAFASTPRHILNDTSALFRGLVVSGATLSDAVSGAIVLKEIADPAAPGADIGRLYVRDNGAAKTQLVIRFPTGAVQVIATEP